MVKEAARTQPDNRTIRLHCLRRIAPVVKLQCYADWFVHAAAAAKVAGARS